MLVLLSVSLATLSGSPLTSVAMAASPNPAPIIARGGWQYPRHTAAAAQAVADPYAPRRDALIYNLAPTAAAAISQSPPTQGGARYYSIHRQAGRTPDMPSLPQPVYLDALPVELEDIPHSEDLATPPAPPVMGRDAQGRLRPLQSSDDFLEY